MALSISQAYKAAIMCSIVATETPASLVILVHSIVSVTKCHKAGMRLLLFVVSVRTNTMPVSAGAGLTVMVTGFAECVPISVKETGVAKDV